LKRPIRTALERENRPMMQRVLVLTLGLLGSLFLTVTVPAAEVELIKIGSRLEPLVDPHLLDRISGSATLIAQRPQPREVVLTADAPWEGNTSAYYTVFQDGEVLRMYYRGSHYDEQ